MPGKKKIASVVRIEQPAGAANMGKLGQTLGPHGVNIVQVAKAYNEASTAHRGLDVAADIIIYEDRSFELALKTPSTVALLKRTAGIEKGSARSHDQKVASITRRQLREVAEVKLPDLNTDDLGQAEKIVEGAARSMGLKVVD